MKAEGLLGLETLKEGIRKKIIGLKMLTDGEPP